MLGFKVDDAAGCMRQDVWERLRGDIEAELPGDRVKHEPAEPVAMHDHKVGPVGTAGLVQEHDSRQGDIAELRGKKAPDKGHIRCQCRADIIWLQERDLPAPGTARAGAPDEGDVAVVAPVENLFYCRFTHF